MLVFFRYNIPMSFLTMSFLPTRDEVSEPTNVRAFLAELSSNVVWVLRAPPAVVAPWLKLPAGAAPWFWWRGTLGVYWFGP